MGEHKEWRAYRRLETMLQVELAPIESDGQAVCRGVTRNVGSGGLYFETDTDQFSPGSIWRLALTVPPGEGHFPYAGQVQGVAEVLRVDDLAVVSPAGRQFGVAACFREPLKLRFQDP